MTRSTVLACTLAIGLTALPTAAAADTSMSAEELRNALVWAIHSDDFGTIGDLLRNGADPNAALYNHPAGNYAGSTPFMVAAARGKIQAMGLLMDAGADIDLSIGHYGSALHMAARNGRADAARMLLNAGADPDVTTPYGGTRPLQLAVKFGRASVVVLLLKSGACVDCEYEAEDGGFYSPLAQAAGEGRMRIVEHLLAAGADVNKPGGDGHFSGTPLAHAAYAGRKFIVEVLVSAGADVNSDGDTPLHGAASMGHLEIVQRLVALGADLDARDPGGRTALALAENSGHEAVAAYLESIGAER